MSTYAGHILIAACLGLTLRPLAVGSSSCGRNSECMPLPQANAAASLVRTRARALGRPRGAQGGRRAPRGQYGPRALAHAGASLEGTGARPRCCHPDCSVGAAASSLHALAAGAARHHGGRPTQTGCPRRGEVRSRGAACGSWPQPESRAKRIRWARWEAGEVQQRLTGVSAGRRPPRRCRSGQSRRRSCACCPWRMSH